MYKIFLIKKITNMSNILIDSSNLCVKKLFNVYCYSCLITSTKSIFVLIKKDVLYRF